MVIAVDPPDIEPAPVVLAISDAPDNDSAIRDIDGWAREHGLVRSREYYLNQRMDTAGRVVRYGACYRLGAGESRAADADIARLRERLDRSPLTTSSDVLLREE